MTIYRPSAQLVYPGARGVRVVQPGGGAAPWWMAAGLTPIAAYQAKDAASYAASKVNLANPGTYNATEGVAPSWAAETGWTFDGSNDYLNTGVTPTGSAQSPYSVFVRCSGVAGSAFFVFGGGENPSGLAFGINPNRWGISADYCNGGRRSVAPGIPAGVFGMCGNQAYRNGAPDGAAIPTGSGIGRAIFLGAANRSAGPDWYKACTIQAWIAYSSTLTALQAALISTAMAAL